jgi:hypothetical protein
MYIVSCEPLFFHIAGRSELIPETEMMDKKDEHQAC